MNRLLARLLAPTLAAAVLFVPAVAQAKPAAPKATAPKVGTTVQNMPALTWNAAKGAAQYEVQIASDSGFNPALIDVTTQNLRFVNAKMLPNGAYFWRVRSIDAANESSKWSGVRKFTKKWNAVAALLTPGEPEHDLLSESRDPHAGRRCRAPSTYRVSVASGAAGGGVDAPGGDHLEGRARVERRRQPDHDRRTRTSPSRHRCTRARTTGRSCRSTPRAMPARRPQIFSFVWIWPGTTTPTVTDMVPGVEIYDPLFQWARDSGRRELRDGDQHHLGLRHRLAVCSAPRRPRTSFAPSATLPNNTYYWRVRGLDPQGQAGPWNNGPTFDKTYDQTAVPGPPNLTVRDSTLTPVAPGDSTMSPSSPGRRSPARATTSCRWTAVRVARPRMRPRRTPPGRRSPRPATRVSRISFSAHRMSR